MSRAITGGAPLDDALQLRIPHEGGQRPIKILHLIYDHSGNPWVGGGGAVRVYELCRRLAERGHDVTVLSGMYPGARDYSEGRLGYRFVGSERGYVLSTFSYAFRAAGFVRKRGRDFDVVVEDFAPWNPVFSSLLSRKPAVLHINHREGWNIVRRWLLLGVPFLVVEALYPRLFSRVTALSEWTKKKIGRPGAVVVPAGISSSMLGGEEAPEGDYIVYVGRLHIKNKGLDTLFDAMKMLPRTRLKLVGRGRDEARLRAMGLGNVEFLGFLPEGEKLRVLRGARLLVLPSRFEGWGIVVLEAAACGKPVVVSDIPELSFATRAGFGVSFRTGNAEDLAEKLRRLAGDETLRGRMSANARQYARGCTWESIAGDYERFLQGVAGGGRGGGEEDETAARQGR